MQFPFWIILKPEQQRQLHFVKRSCCFV